MDQNNPPIICDTNIWYRISTGDITQQDIADRYLVGTFVTGAELCSSPNAYKDYDRLRRAITAFNHYHMGLCGHSPTEYMKRVSGHEAQDTEWKEIGRALYAAEKTENLGDVGLTRKLFSDNEEMAKRSNEPFLNVISEHREWVKIGGRGRHKKNMNLPEIRLEHKEVTKELLITTVGGLPMDWSALELFLSTFDEWLRQLAIQPTLTMTINDWNDVLNNHLQSRWVC